MSEDLRPLHHIADEISREWGGQPKGVNFAARPYLDAMRHLSTVHDRFGMESGSGIVSYFLSNASQFKGEAAKRIKAELKAHQKAPRPRSDLFNDRREG